MPRRICLLLGSAGVGGTEMNTLRVASALQGMGHVPCVAWLSQDGPIIPRFQAAGIHTASFPLTGFLRGSALRQAGRFHRFLRGQRFDVLHAQDVYANVFGIPMARLAKVPLALASRRWWNDHFSPGLSLANRAACRLAHGVVSNSAVVAQRAAAEYGLPGGRVAVVPNIVPDALFEPPRLDEVTSQRAQWGVPAHHRVLGCSARLVPVKDHETLLRAFAGVAAAFPEAALILAGEGGSEEALRVRCRELHIASRVHFIGGTPPGLNAHHYFDISVLSSTSESSPNAVSEAMAAGRPVIATAVGGVSELVEAGVTGLLVPPGDPEAMATAMLRLCREPEEASRLGMAGRQRAERLFREASVMARWERLYSSGTTSA